MSTTEKTGRAWVPSIVASILAIVLAAASGLALEVLEDRDVAALSDPDSRLGAFVYGQLAPVGSPGLVGDRDFADSITQLGGGLVPVLVLVYLFTWLGARGRSGIGVLLGAWLGTVLGVGLGGFAMNQVFLWQIDNLASEPGLDFVRVDRIETGLYWGAAAGLLVGLVALLAWLPTRRTADEPVDETYDARHEDTVVDEPAYAPPYPPPDEHAQPAPAQPTETVRRPPPDDPLG